MDQRQIGIKGVDTSEQAPTHVIIVTCISYAIGGRAREFTKHPAGIYDLATALRRLNNCLDSQQCSCDGHSAILII